MVLAAAVVAAVDVRGPSGVKELCCGLAISMPVDAKLAVDPEGRYCDCLGRHWAGYSWVVD